MSLFASVSIYLPEDRLPGIISIAFPSTINLLTSSGSLLENVVISTDLTSFTGKFK